MIAATVITFLVLSGAAIVFFLLWRKAVAARILAEKAHADLVEDLNEMTEMHGRAAAQAIFLGGKYDEMVKLLQTCRDPDIIDARARELFDGTYHHPET